MERALCAATAAMLVLCLIMSISLALMSLRSSRGDHSHSGASPTAQHLVNDDLTKEQSVIASEAAASSSSNRLDKTGKFLRPNKMTGKMNGTDGVCTTKGCVRAASDLIKNMNEDVSPCDDFYQFACGGWIKNQVIPDDRTTVSVFSLLQDELNHKLRVLVEAPGVADEPPFFESMRNLYRSCLNLTAIEKAGDTPLHLALKRFGGWPIVVGPNWEGATTFDWIDILIKFRELGFNHDILIDLSVTPDFRNNTRHIIDLDQTSLGMPDRNYLLRGLNDSAVAAYYKLMVDSAVFLGADRATAEKEMFETLQFETTLASYCLPREERRNISSLYNKMNIAEIEKLAPNIKWSKYFGALLGTNVTASDEIIVNVPKFLTKLDALLLTTDKRLLANYMLWRVVLQSFSMLGKRWRELAQEFNTVVTGQAREEPRWEQCISSVTGSLGIALSSLYVRNHFKGQSKEKALEMVGYIHREFLKILHDVDWMDDRTKQRARDKAMAIRPYIGYPNELFNNTEIENFYSGLSFSKNEYFNNVQTLRKWSTDYAFGQLNKTNKKGDWRKHGKSAVVNAFYNIIENSIEFPAGILQGAFFSSDRPNYLNFGAIGFVIGHEITHGFDDKGRQFDKDGNNINWWEAETDKRFKERAQCIIEQYGNYTVPENGLKVNGVNTQGENIADNAGLVEAYRAYQMYVKDNGEESSLPGLKYTPKQLFWISAANIWCGKYRPEVLKLRVQVGSHSPAQFRVVGTVSNLVEFAETFNCPIGSPMRPVKKCSVW